MPDVKWLVLVMMFQWLVVTQVLADAEPAFDTFGKKSFGRKSFLRKREQEEQTEPQPQLVNNFIKEPIEEDPHKIKTSSTNVVAQSTRTNSISSEFHHPHEPSVSRPLLEDKDSSFEVSNPDVTQDLADAEPAFDKWSFGKNSFGRKGFPMNTVRKEPLPQIVVNPFPLDLKPASPVVSSFLSTVPTTFSALSSSTTFSTTLSVDSSQTKEFEDPTSTSKTPVRVTSKHPPTTGISTRAAIIRSEFPTSTFVVPIIVDSTPIIEAITYKSPTSITVSSAEELPTIAQEVQEVNTSFTVVTTTSDISAFTSRALSSLIPVTSTVEVQTANPISTTDATYLPIDTSPTSVASISTKQPFTNVSITESSLPPASTEEFSNSTTEILSTRSLTSLSLVTSPSSIADLSISTKETLIESTTRTPSTSTSTDSIDYTTSSIVPIPALESEARSASSLASVKTTLSTVTAVAPSTTKDASILTKETLTEETLTADSNIGLTSSSFTTGSTASPSTSSIVPIPASTLDFTSATSPTATTVVSMTNQPFIMSPSTTKFSRASSEAISSKLPVIVDLSTTSIDQGVVSTKASTISTSGLDDMKGLASTKGTAMVSVTPLSTIVKTANLVEELSSNSSDYYTAGGITTTAKSPKLYVAFSEKTVSTPSSSTYSTAASEMIFDTHEPSVTTTDVSPLAQFSIFDESPVSPTTVDNSVLVTDVYQFVSSSTTEEVIVASVTVSPSFPTSSPSAENIDEAELTLPAAKDLMGSQEEITIKDVTDDLSSLKADVYNSNITSVTSSVPTTMIPVDYKENNITTATEVLGFGDLNLYDKASDESISIQETASPLESTTTGFKQTQSNNESIPFNRVEDSLTKIAEAVIEELIVTDDNVIEDDVSSLLPPGFVVKESKFSKLSNKYKKNYKAKSKTKQVKESGNLGQVVGLSQFGKVITTTVDPISQILADVVIVDITNYLPKGYDFRLEDPEETKVIEPLENINDLLIEKEVKGKSKFRPGKLNGKKLAAISNELKEAELYYATFGGKKPKVNVEKDIEIEKQEYRPKSTPSKYGWKEPKKNTVQKDRQGKTLSDASLEFSADSIFASILGGESIKLEPVVTEKVEPKLARPVTSRPITSRPITSRPLTSAPKTTETAIITTTTLRPTTPGICGEFCSLAGTIVIKSGLEWSEELLHQFTDIYKDASSELVSVMTDIFSHVYFGSAFEFVSIDAISRQGETVLVDIYVQYTGIVFNVTTVDMKTAFKELLEVENGTLMMGKFEIDVESTYFLVADTSTPLENITFEKYGVALPDWAWLVVTGGVFSFLIISFFGVIMGVQKCKHDQIVQKKVLNPKTLQAFRDQKHFDEVHVDKDTAYLHDKRDMWTLQKVQQREAKKPKSKFGHSDSGRGSAMSSSTEKNFASELAGGFGKVSSFGKGGKLFSSFGKGKRVNHNDSNAELLGLDNTGFDETKEIMDNATADRSTSYENEKEGYEGKVGSNAVFLARNDFTNDFVNHSRSNLLVSLGDEGINYDSDDDDSDGVSDGPSEKF